MGEFTPAVLIEPPSATPEAVEKLRHAIQALLARVAALEAECQRLQYQQCKLPQPIDPKRWTTTLTAPMVPGTITVPTVIGPAWQNTWGNT